MSYHAESMDDYQYVQLAFDPYAELASENGDTGQRSAVTRLAFTTATGVPLVITNLSKPITFTLSGVDLAGSASGGASAAERQAQCVFWDPFLSTFADYGCTTQPNPLPAGVGVGWVPGFESPVEKDLVKVRTGPRTYGHA